MNQSILLSKLPRLRRSKQGGDDGSILEEIPPLRSPSTLFFPATRFFLPPAISFSCTIRKPLSFGINQAKKSPFYVISKARRKPGWALPLFGLELGQAKTFISKIGCWRAFFIFISKETSLHWARKPCLYYRII